jgi:hypothetical protein
MLFSGKKEHHSTSMGAVPHFTPEIALPVGMAPHKPLHFAALSPPRHGTIKNNIALPPSSRLDRMTEGPGVASSSASA